MPDEPSMLWRAVSVVGFLLLVGAYLLNQRGLCSASSRRYLGANVLGSGLLAAYSVVIDEPIFVGLEGLWCLGSLLGLLRGPPPVDGPTESAS
jgi:hypothetical protein